LGCTNRKAVLWREVKDDENEKKNEKKKMKKKK
jgi:hypothetical protein